MKYTPDIGVQGNKNPTCRGSWVSRLYHTLTQPTSGSGHPTLKPHPAQPSHKYRPNTKPAPTGMVEFVFELGCETLELSWRKGTAVPRPRRPNHPQWQARIMHGAPTGCRCRAALPGLRVLIRAGSATQSRGRCAIQTRGTRAQARPQQSSPIAPRSHRLPASRDVR